jgi:hypothetical protein
VRIVKHFEQFATVFWFGRNQRGQALEQGAMRFGVVGDRQGDSLAYGVMPEFRKLEHTVKRSAIRESRMQIC